MQLHDASHLHCDFRLQWANGALRSWAVPKGPSLDPGVKRLAVEVEDHPADYASFEGEIPAGQYGAGRVIVWDHGDWIPEGDPLQGYERGNLKFMLQGQRLRGRWVLIRTRRNQGAKQQWLLLKERDADAQPGLALQFDRTATSVISGRTLDTIASPQPASVARARPGRSRTPLPATLSCQLATEAEAAPQDPGWWFETKFDGYRMLARIAGAEVRLISRSGRDWTARFPSVAGALADTALDGSWLDGEVVVLDERGLSRFQRLQNALDAGNDADVRYFVFDAPFLQREDLRARPLSERKSRLEAALTPVSGGAIATSPHVLLDAASAQRDACEMGFEGLIAKRLDAPYRSGRSRDWLKLKCRKRQELVVVGYTEPAGARAHFGALLLAHHDGTRGLRYAGRVGTGFSAARLADLAARLQSLRIDAPALAVPRQPGGRVHWVQPALVADVEFTEWTEDGLVRQASFVGLREDKEAHEVQRERGVEPVTRKTKARVRSRAKVKAAAPRVTPTAPRVTHATRIVFPRAGALSAPLTKGALAQYYVSIAPFLLPHVIDRPLALVRAPDGLNGAHFFQKHLHGHFPAPVGSISITDSHGEPKDHICVRDADGLVALAQMGGVELHGWGCRAPDVERPDRLVFDLDPDESLPWARVVEAAELTRTVLESLRLRVLLMTTGGKGLHLVAHIVPKADWDAIEPFARAVAEHIAGVLPAQFTASMSKARRRNRIFIDYLRNQRAATAVMPYSVRLRTGAPVATPITWDELRGGIQPADYNVETVVARLRTRRADPWGRAAPQAFNAAAALRRLQRLRS